MAAIEKTIAAINLQGPEGKISIRAVAKKFGVEASTLTRRYHNITRSRAAAAERRRLITPQHEAELVKYIIKQSGRAIPPTRSMIKKFVAGIAQWEPSDSWVTRFLKRNRANITIKTSTGIDRDRHKADNITLYRRYFRLLHDKLDQYDIQPHDIYNMDEKGFLLRVNCRSKRVFSKQLWDQKKVTAPMRDGSREWITTIGCICADGSWVDPMVIFEGKSGLHDDWVQHLQPDLHQMFFATSDSGWSNNELGVSWLKQVFDRQTKDKAKRDYRLLLLDGHGSHITPDFIDYCDSHRILLAVLPPHSSHRLQPLDVVMFKPLSTAYSNELNDLVQRSQGLYEVRKSDFLRLFLAAFTHSFTSDKIVTSFAATGVHPRNAEVPLRRLKISTPQHDIDIEVGDQGNGDT
ncbi:hypothetical protein BM1_00732 [Bipolaris maydis]|nr:hypothetical protein BM1_00732 [Bipolaris maydis]